MIDFSVILASTWNGVIGNSETNDLPWGRALKTDLKKYAFITKNGILIMGRKTADSFPNGPVLKNRQSIVISSTEEKHAQHQNVHYVKNFQEALAKAKELFVQLYPHLELSMTKLFVFAIGGKGVFEEAFQSPYCQQIYWTRLLTNLNLQSSSCVTISEDRLDKRQFELQIEDGQIYFEGGYAYQFHVYRRKKPHGEYQYLDVLRKLMVSGHHRQTRNSATYSLFGERLEFDLADGFPLLTTKFLPLRLIFVELKLFLTGKTNNKVLTDEKCQIWTKNTRKEFIESVGLPYNEGDMGNMYGFQWLHFGAEYRGMEYNYEGEGYNQLAKAIELIKKDPYSRRILMTTFDPSKAHLGVLYPCHSIVLQWYVEVAKGAEGAHRLSVQMYQRSADYFLGCPFNIASTSLLVHLFCVVINSDPEYKGPKFVPGRVLMPLGDVHLYDQQDHIKGARLQLQRQPFPFPTIKIKKETTKFEDFNWEDIELTNYEHHPAIKAEMVA